MNNYIVHYLLSKEDISLVSIISSISLDLRSVLLLLYAGVKFLPACFDEIVCFKAEDRILVMHLRAKTPLFVPNIILSECLTNSTMLLLRFKLIFLSD